MFIINGLENTNMVVLVRYFELLVRLCLLSETISACLEEIAIKVFKKFFEYDILTQITIMDFINEMSKKPWTSMILAKSDFL